MKKALMVFSVFLAIILFVSCGKSQMDSEVVGKYVLHEAYIDGNLVDFSDKGISNADSSILELSNDGTYTWTFADETDNGKWKKEDAYYLLSSKDDNIDVAAYYDDNSKTITIKSLDGMDLVYIKITT